MLLSSVFFACASGRVALQRDATVNKDIKVDTLYTLPIYKPEMFEIVYSPEIKKMAYDLGEEEGWGTVAKNLVDKERITHESKQVMDFKDAYRSSGYCQGFGVALYTFMKNFGYTPLLLDWHTGWIKEDTIIVQTDWFSPAHAFVYLDGKIYDNKLGEVELSEYEFPKPPFFEGKYDEWEPVLFILAYRKKESPTYYTRVEKLDTTHYYYEWLKDGRVQMFVLNEFSIGEAIIPARSETLKIQIIDVGDRKEIDVRIGEGESQKVEMRYPEIPCHIVYTPEAEEVIKGISSWK